ncbi:MAG: hypothetical protein KKG09_09920 [Verrucomicrobia bacterium]|nr:hypothetical protein [Verrucomicrobiota bacterium]
MVTTKNHPAPRERSAAASEPGTKAAPCAAFTLLEVILSLGIVTMLVLMIANMFQEVSVSWNLGTQSAERNTAGRAAVDFIARELAQAVAGPIDAAQPPVGHPNIRFQLINGNELRFVALAGEVQNGRALRGALFRYQITERRLQYWRQTGGAFDPYSTDPGWTGGQMLVTNVTDFQVLAFAGAGDLAGGGVTDYDSSANDNRLPVCVDIYLEVLGNDDAVKAGYITIAADKTAFINSNTRRYTTRVFFNNRMGWAGRPE